MEYNGQKIRLGDVVEVNGEKRIVTKIERDTFYSNPYTEDEAKIEMETVKVEEPVVKSRKRGKSK